MKIKTFWFRNAFLFCGLFGIFTTLLFPQGAIADNDVVVVRYYRLDKDYNGWSLLIRDLSDKTKARDIKEVQSIGVDKFGLVFMLNKKDFQGNSIGFLPVSAKMKEHPTRKYNANMGPQVWMVQGDPALYSTEPDLSALLLLHYYRMDGKYDDWTLWTWTGEKKEAKDEKREHKELQPCGMDKYGLMFVVSIKSYYKPMIGVLPKYQAWKKKDEMPIGFILPKWEMRYG